MHSLEDTLSLLKSSTQSVVPLFLDYAAAYDTGWHTDFRGQLTGVLKGTLLVNTEAGAWVVPPQRAVWIPAQHPHRLWINTNVRRCDLFLDQTMSEFMPNENTVIQLSPLIRELFFKVLTFKQPYDEDGAEGRLARVLVDQLSDSPTEPMLLPTTEEPRLRKMLDNYHQNPSDPRSIKEWASYLGVSVRTLSRLFEIHLGMNFTSYRQQVRMFMAVQKLAEGQPVSRAALDVGFESQSSFTKLFRRTFGVTPKQYFALQ